MRRANSRSRFCQFLNFVSRPSAKSVSQWVVAASESLALAANRAFGVQIVIATVQPALGVYGVLDDRDYECNNFENPMD